MKRERDFDLKNYDEVRARAAKILERLERGDMPCDASWPPDRVQLFKLVRTRKAWIAPFATVVRIDWEAATAVNSANTWTPKALAELVEGLGGHSQSGSTGHHMARILKEHGKLHLLKGLITIEGGCSLTNAGLAADGSDFKTIAYMAFKGDYTAPSAGCLATVNAIKAIGGKADNIELDQAGWWQGNYAGPFGNDYVGPFAGVSHMMMIEDNPAPGRHGKPTNLQVMDVLLEWTKRNIKSPKTIECDWDDDHDHDNDDDHHHH